MKNLFVNSEILLTETGTPGDFTYLPFGRAIRERFVSEISNILKSSGFDEWHFHDIINQGEIDKMNEKIMDISKNVYNIGSVNSTNKNYVLAPTHEIPISNIMSKYIKHSSQLPMHFFHIGQAFRKQYKAPFPFNLSKRNTYIEGYGFYKTKKEVEDKICDILSLNKYIFDDVLQLPYLISERPLITNKPISRKTIALDIITKLHKTLHAGMIYSHEDIFTDLYKVKYHSADTSKNINVQSLHFGFTDNLLMATLMESFDKDNCLVLPEKLIPYHIIFLDTCPHQVIERFSSQTKKIFRIKRNINQGSLKKQIRTADLQGTIIQIKGEDEQGNYIYKTRNMSGWLIGSENEIINKVHNEIQLRTTNKKAVNEDIIRNKIIYCDNIEGIQKSIESGHIITTYLQKSNEYIGYMEKLLVGSEILGFYKSNNIGECILTQNKTNDMIYISKRI